MRMRRARRWRRAAWRYSTARWTREWGKRTASFADPDGNIWEIAQELSPADGA
jgi:uncharacterized glyoxalase superfamily protein PhnB